MSAEVLIRPLLEGDVEALAAGMRAEDAAEVRAAHGLDPLEVLRRSVDASPRVWAAELGGELACIFGVEFVRRRSMLDEQHQVVWMLTGPAVARHPVAFVRASWRVMAKLLELFPVLANMVDARYAAALRWAKHLGAEIQPAQPWGVAGLPFHLVTWRRSSWALRH